jgi:hypothetical protein
MPTGIEIPSNERQFKDAQAFRFMLGRSIDRHRDKVKESLHRNASSFFLEEWDALIIDANQAAGHAQEIVRIKRYLDTLN